MKKAFILHGWTYATEKWNPFINFLKEKNIDAKFLKIPGLTQKTDRVWCIDDYVKWLGKNLKREKRKIILIGHSNGGRIALNFAIKHPEKISKLVLIDSAGIYHNELPLRIKRAVFKGAAKIGKELFPGKVGRDILYFFARESEYKNASPKMKTTMVNLIESDKALGIDRISVPTIIIWGRNDGVTPASDGKILNARIKDSKLFLIDGARHSPQFTHPQQVTGIILKEL